MEWLVQRALGSSENRFEREEDGVITSTKTIQNMERLTRWTDGCMFLGVSSNWRCYWSDDLQFYSHVIISEIVEYLSWVFYTKKW